jgi:hypothetical protein
MKRLKLVLALALALAIMATVSVAPALANDNNRLERKDLRLDRQILHELRNDDNDFGCFGCGFHDFNDCCDDDFGDVDFVLLSPFGFNTFDSVGCWAWSWVFERWDWDDDCD